MMKFRRRNAQSEDLTTFARDDRGASLVAYGIVVGLVAVGAIASVGGVGESVRSLLSEASSSIADPSLVRRGGDGEGNDVDDEPTTPTLPAPTVAFDDSLLNATEQATASLTVGNVPAGADIVYTLSDGVSVSAEQRSSNAPGGVTTLQSNMIPFGFNDGTITVSLRLEQNGEFSDTVTATTVLDTTAPILNTIEVIGNANTFDTIGGLDFLVTFSESVENIGTADFAANTSSTATVTGVNGTGDTRTVTVGGGNLGTWFQGSVGLQAAPALAFTDIAGNDGTANITTNQSYNANEGTTVVEFTNIGSTSWTPPSGVTQVRVLVIGGGGGGGAGGGGTCGGGGGGYAVGVYTVNSSTSYSIAVGKGGGVPVSGQPYQYDGGGTSSFDDPNVSGTTIRATGGEGCGNQSSAKAGGQGSGGNRHNDTGGTGSAPAGNAGGNGATGGGGSYPSSTNGRTDGGLALLPFGGDGGDGAGNSVSSSLKLASNASNYGGGGGGGGGSGPNGYGDYCLGAQGYVRVEYIQ